MSIITEPPPDHFVCMRCGKKLHAFDCPNGRVPISHDQDGGTFAARWYFPLRHGVAQIFFNNDSS